MRLLLDTHVAYWAVAKRLRLPQSVRDMISSTENDILVSAVSLWEISIKHALSKKGVGVMPISGEQALGAFREAGYTLLAVTPEHAVAVERLPQLHDDPFDRLLIAQAMSEPLRLITHDAQVAAYGDTVILF